MRQQILNDIKGEYYQNNYPNDGQRFVAWYLRNIHGLDEIQARDCITDGPNDKQIDAVYIDEGQMTIYVIQGKFNAKDKVDAVPLREVVSLLTQLGNLKNLQEHANKKLVVKINEISRALEDNCEVCFELITTSKLTKQAEADYEQFKQSISANEDINASFVLVDNDVLKVKYNEAHNKNNELVNFDFSIEPDKCMQMELNGIKTILAAIPLKECVNIPGIRDGRLFEKNVRQSLGTSNKVNKGIAKTIKDTPSDFFFYHNGITAICSEVKLDSSKGKIEVKDINVVNGCQSLSTIYSHGQAAKSSDGYILFKFYEIEDDSNLSDENSKVKNISKYTNSQSSVKAIDMRSNEQIILSMKKSYEHKYKNGFFKTKRGEEYPKDRIVDDNHVIVLSAFGKQLMAWQNQRPNISYGETKIFDVYFNTLFHKDYKPEDMQALNEMFNKVLKLWDNKSNPMNIQTELLAMKAYAPYHHLYAISALANVINQKTEKVPSPSKVYKKIKDADMLEKILKFTGRIINSAFNKANKSITKDGKVFVPPNWLKSGESVEAINETINDKLDTMSSDGEEFYEKLSDCLKLNDSDYTDRRSAD